jgi:hypothetical protein
MSKTKKIVNMLADDAAAPAAAHTLAKAALQEGKLKWSSFAPTTRCR